MAEQVTQVGYVGYSGTGYQYCSEVITNSQDTVNNTSNITVNFKVMPTGNSAGFTQWSSSTSTMTISSTNGLSQSVDITGQKTVNTKNSYTTIGTWTGTVTHNNDGTLYITVDVTYGFVSPADAYLPKKTTTSFTTALTTIARASTITLSASSATISSTSGSITWTATSKADFYHTLTWKIGSGTATTVSGVNRINNTTQTGTIAYTDILSAMPTASTGTFTMTLTTYSNSGKTTTVGTKTASCTITITIKPTTTLGNIAVASSPISSYAIAGYSTLSSAFTATKPSGASGITTYFSISTGSMSTTSSTATSGTATSNVLPSNTGTGTYTVTISAYSTDSRGITGTTVTKTKTCYQYKPPTATLNAYRVATSSSTSADGAGEYLYVTYSSAVGASINSQNTIQTTSCVGSGGVSGTLANGSHTALAITSTATVTLTVTDKVGGTNTLVKQIPTASFPIDMYDNGAGTVGVAIGGIARSGYLDNYLSFVSAKPLQVNVPNTSATGYARVYVRDTTSQVRTYLNVGSGHSNHGLYSDGYSTDGLNFTSDGIWIIYRDANGKVALNKSTTDIYYQDGDTQSLSNLVASGLITTSTKDVYLYIEFPKRLDNINTITCTSLNASARGISGYLNSTSGSYNYTNDTENYTITINKTSSASCNSIRLVLSKSTAWTNVTNNTPVVFFGTFSFSFSTT